MNNRIRNILKHHHVRSTSCRNDVIAFFLQKEQAALSQPELEKHLSAYDRVTLYRTLNTFLEKGIVHKVPGDSGSIKYALCSEQCDEHQHHDEHIHFKCTSCGQVKCIDTVSIPPIQLPEGYIKKSSSFLVNGICALCHV